MKTSILSIFCSLLTLVSYTQTTNQPYQVNSLKYWYLIRDTIWGDTTYNVDAAISFTQTDIEVQTNSPKQTTIKYSIVDTLMFVPDVTAFQCKDPQGLYCQIKFWKIPEYPTLIYVVYDDRTYKYSLKKED